MASPGDAASWGILRGQWWGLEFSVTCKSAMLGSVRFNLGRFIPATREPASRLGRVGDVAEHLPGGILIIATMAALPFVLLYRIGELWLLPLPALFVLVLTLRGGATVQLLLLLPMFLPRYRALRPHLFPPLSLSLRKVGCPNRTSS
jgi:hypothetical protein